MATDIGILARDAILGNPTDPEKKPFNAGVVDVFKEAQSQINDINDSVTSLVGRVDVVEVLATSGIKPMKEEVRVLANTNVTIASGLENGDTVDGVVLITGDRVALAGQSIGSENGFYIVASSGAASRATDMDSEADILGAYFSVKEGTHATEVWSCITVAPITVGSTTITFKKGNSANPTTAEIVAARDGKTSLSSRLDPLFTALEDTFTYGPRDSSILASGTNDGSNVSYSVDEPIPFDCVVESIVLNSKTAGTFYLKANTVIGSTETEVARYSVYSPGSGIRTITSFGSDMVFHAGEILSRYGWGVFQFDTTSISASDGGFWASGAGNVAGFNRTGGAPVQTYDLMMIITFKRLAVTSDDVDAIGDVAEENEIQVSVLRHAASNLKQSVFGRMRDPVIGTAPTARQTVLQLNGAFGRGYIKGFQCWAERDEVGVPLRMYVRDATTHDFVCVREIFVDVLAADPTLIPARMRVEFGELCGTFNNANFHITTSASDGGAYWAITGNLKRFNLNSLVGNLRQEWAALYEYDSPGLNRIGNTPMPGQPLLPEHIVKAFDVYIDLHEGESIGVGTQAQDYLYTAVNQVETFAQGPRAAKSGTLSGAISQNGGTATKVPAQERASNAGNSYAYDTVAGVVGTVRGNTGSVAAADQNINISAREYGFPRSKHRRFVVAVGRSGKMLHEYSMSGTALWSQLLREDLAEAKARYAEEDPDLKVGCVTVYWTNGNNPARGAFVDMDDYPGNGSAVTIDETTIEAVKDQIKRELSDVSDYIRGILGQDVQPHFHSHQLSSYIQGDGDFSLVPRNGWWQKAQIEIAREVGYFHCYGPDFESERYSVDHAHFQGRGYTRRDLVQARGAAEVERGMIRPVFAMPLGTELSGSVITQYWWTPTGIVLDTSTFSAMTNNGLSVTINGLDTPVALTSVSAPVQVNGNLWSISATITTPPSPGDDVYFHIGMHYGLSTGSGGAVDEARHNYRLGRTETITGAMVNNVSMTLHTWLPHWFEKADWV